MPYSRIIITRIAPNYRIVPSLVPRSVWTSSLCPPPPPPKRTQRPRALMLMDKVVDIFVGMFFQSWPTDNEELKSQQPQQRPWSAEHNQLQVSAQIQSHSLLLPPNSVPTMVSRTSYAPQQPAPAMHDIKPFAFQYAPQPPPPPHFEGHDGKLYDSNFPQYPQAHSEETDVKGCPPASSGCQQWRLPQIQNSYEPMQFQPRHTFFSDRTNPSGTPATMPEQNASNLASNAYMPVTSYAPSSTSSNHFHYVSHSSPTSPTHPTLYYSGQPVNNNVSRHYPAPVTGSEFQQHAYSHRGYSPPLGFQSPTARAKPPTPNSINHANPFGNSAEGSGSGNIMDSVGGDAPHLWSNHHFNASAVGSMQDRSQPNRYDHAHPTPILQPITIPATMSQSRRYSTNSGVITSAPVSDLHQSTHYAPSASASPATTTSVTSPLYPPYMKSYHYKVPLTDRPFQCDKCPQSFNRNHDLKRHKRIHLAVKPFPCPSCDKQFSRKDALKRHCLVKRCGQKSKSPDNNSGGGDLNRDEKKNMGGDGGDGDGGDGSMSSASSTA